MCQRRLTLGTGLGDGQPAQLGLGGQPLGARDKRAEVLVAGLDRARPEYSAAAASPERPGARRSTVLRGVGWGWTGAAGWGRVARRDGLWYRGISKKACFFCPLHACRIGQRCQALACSRQAGGRLLCYNSHRSTVFVTPYGTSSSDREVRIILTTRSGNMAAA